MSKPSKLAVSILGATATGKTSLSWQLANDLLKHSSAPKRIDFLLADSRQVYRGLEVISGADLPDTFVQKQSSALRFPFWQDQQLYVHGLSCLAIDQDWSVADFQQLVQEVAKVSWAEGGAVFIVGGTGLYHRHVFNSQLTQKPAPDVELRTELAAKTLVELQQQLQRLAPENWQRLHISDQANPRRLIRAIEAQITAEKNDIKNRPDLVLPDTWLKVGLQASKQELKALIFQRVLARLQSGAVAEVQDLVKKVEEKSLHNGSVLTTTGVRELLAFLQGETTQSEMIDAWSLREYQYAKRQLTWFKKEEGVFWFDPSSERQYQTMLESVILSV